MPQERDEGAREIERIAKRRGADLVGFANLRRIKGIFTFPEDMINEFPYAVSVALSLEKFGKYSTPTEDDFAFPLLESVARELKKFIESKGYSAKVVLADKRVASSSPLYWRGEISHKAVAKTAGLGWIGRSTLLVTPCFGPRVCLVSVLTDMPLPVGKPMKSRCGNCRICIAACPLSALKHSGFEDHPKRIEDAIDVKKCGAFVNKTWRNLDLCYECMLACPKWPRASRRRKTTS